MNPNPIIADEHVTLWHGDCLDVLATLNDNCIDAVITDPPYGIGFMGKQWDSGKSFVERKAQKSNTFDHVGGNHNPSNAADAARTRRVESAKFGAWCSEWAEECFRVLKPGGHIAAFGGTRTWHRLAVAIEDAGFEIRDNLAWLYGSGFPKGANVLKPAFEPIVLARKPVKGTVAANVVQHGTGGLNIDACRIEAHDDQLAAKYASVQNAGQRNNAVYGIDNRDRAGAEPHAAGRWPTNAMLDEKTAEQVDQQSGITRDGVAVQRNGGGQRIFNSGDGLTRADQGFGGEGGASRFFPVFKYTAKAPGDERPSVNGIAHPTVKPLELMRWLVRLITPPGGVVLDPFAGSGTTAEACIHEHRTAIVIEREADYLPLIQARLSKPMEIGFNFEEGA